MSFHRNAKLGLAGRYALVSAIAGGMTLKAVAAAFNVSPATAHLGGTAGRGRARTRVAACHVCSIARTVRFARRAGSRPSSPRRSESAGDRPAGGRDLSPARPALRTQWCGKCSAVLASHALPSPSGSQPTATSGPAPATCCTWTRAAMRAFRGLGTGSPATARRNRVIGCVRRHASATSTRTRSPTTTRGWPSWSCTLTKGQAP